MIGTYYNMEIMTPYDPNMSLFLLYSSLAKWRLLLGKKCPKPFFWKDSQPYAWIHCFMCEKFVRPILEILVAWLVLNPLNKSS